MSSCRLSNDKPSAIFRLRGSFSSNTSLQHQAWDATTTNVSMAQNVNSDVTAVLGFSVEPLSAIQAQLDTLHSALAKPNGGGPNADPTFLAEKVVKHLFNYLSSCAESSAPGAGASLTPDSLVPMKVITMWYETFMGKIRSGGPAFLDRTE